MTENLARMMVLFAVLCGCTRKPTYLLNLDFKALNEHEQTLVAEKKRGIEEGLSSGSIWRFFFGPRIELVDIAVESADGLAAILEERKGSVFGCVTPLRTERVLAMQPALAAAGIVCVAPVATGPQLKNLPGIFTLSPDATELGRGLAKIATERFAARRIAVLSFEDAASENAALLRGFVEGAPLATVSETVLKDASGGVENFRIVREVVEKNWDVIFVSSYFAGALAVVEEISLAASKETIVLGLDSWNNAAYLKELSSLERVRVFVPQLFRREGAEDSVVRVAARDATGLIVKSEGRIGEARSYHGTSGQLSCDGKNCLGALGLFEAKEGKLVPVASFPLR